MPSPRPLRISSRLCTALVSSLALLAAFSTSALAANNDDFADARAIPTVNGAASFQGDTTGAGVEVDEPIVSGATTNSTLWYRYTPTKSGVARVGACAESAADTALGVYTGSSLVSLTSVASGTDNCPFTAGPRTGNFNVTAGTTYWIQLGNETDRASWVFVDFSNSGAPANDNIANAATLSGSLPITANFSNYFATGEPGEIGDGRGGFPWNTVWFKFAVPSTGTYVFETCGSPNETQDSVVSIYTSGSSGPAVSDLTPAFYNDDSCKEVESPYLSRAVGDLTGSTTVWVQVGNYMAESGTRLSLKVKKIGAPEVVDALPKVDGDARPGQTLNAQTGDWRNADTFSYQWVRCDANGDACAEISGATGAQYIVDPGDVGSRIRAKVTGNNSSGSNMALARSSAIVSDFPPNDDVADATDLGNDLNEEYLGDNYFASYEGDYEPWIIGDPRDASVWFTWTAPSNGTFQFSTCNGPREDAYDHAGPFVEVFTSSSDPGGPTTLTGVSSTESGCEGSYGDGYEADLTAVAGTKYWIGVGTEDDNQTRYRLTVNPAAKPEFTKAPSLSGTVAVGETITAKPGALTPAGAMYFGWYSCDRDHNNCVDLHEAGLTHLVSDTDANGSLKFVVEANDLTGTTTASAFIDPPAPTTETPADKPIAKPADPLKIVAPGALGTVKAGKKGALTFKGLQLSCGASATGACTGTAGISAKVKGRAKTLGSAKITILPGGASVVKIKLSKAGLKAVKKAKKLKATLTVTASAPGYAAQTSTIKLTLKP